MILAIASSLTFVGIVVLLLLADKLESQSLQEQVRALRADPPVHLSISEAFDPVYSVLWEAPVAALTLIDSAGVTGIPAARLRPIYKAAAAQFPEIYDGCGFVAWLQFLEDAEMIVWDGARLVLTPGGQAFLRFRFVTTAVVEA